MPFIVVGGVFLDTVRFNTDPEPYEPLNWQKRRSKHPAIGLKLTIQDFGTTKKDNTLRLGSSANRFLEESVVAALHSRWRTRGVMYGFTDWLSNEFQVFFDSFLPVPVKKGRDASTGATVSLYSYTAELHVLNIVTLFGTPYTGS